MPYNAQGWYPKKSRHERPTENYGLLLLIIGLLAAFAWVIFYGAATTGGL